MAAQPIIQQQQAFLRETSRQAILHSHASAALSLVAPSPYPNPVFKAVIFDLDGTLVDSVPDIVRATNYAMSTLGLPTFSIEQARPILGGGTKKLIHRALTKILGHAPDDELFKKACDLKTEFENGPTGHENKRAFPGVHDMLRNLQAAGVQLAVLSNSVEQNVRACVEEKFHDINWTHVAGARKDTPLKPNPFAALRISSEMMSHVHPSDCVFVGDSDFDMKTGKAAGMTPLGVPWGIRKVEQLMETGAEIVVAKTEDIVNFVITGRHWGPVLWRAGIVVFIAIVYFISF